jgi:undecaprenyl diphosphate synthase
MILADPAILETYSEKELIELARQRPLPAHIAIIMDGNGRWAKEKGLTRILGHREGIHSVREVITLCRELEIGVLTIYAFSVENWKRPELEIKTLMLLLEEYLKKELRTMMDNDIQFRALGRIEKLPSSVIQSIRRVETETGKNKTMTLNIALNYGGRTEIIDAVQRFNEDVQQGTRSFKDLDEKLFSDYLYTKGSVDPDLMIRTSGEERISNFLLWQMAYTELYFSKTLWPDFRRRDLLMAILDFQRRERRFGKIAPEIPQESANAKR